jgi:hypothetical protein
MYHRSLNQFMAFTNPIYARPIIRVLILENRTSKDLAVFRQIWFYHSRF